MVCLAIFMSSAPTQVSSLTAPVLWPRRSRLLPTKRENTLSLSSLWMLPQPLSMVTTSKWHSLLTGIIANFWPSFSDSQIVIFQPAKMVTKMEPSQLAYEGKATTSAIVEFIKNNL